jgi:hypothetical protein
MRDKNLSPGVSRQVQLNPLSTRDLRYTHSNFGRQSEVVTRHLESIDPDRIDSYLWLCCSLYFFDPVKCQVDGVFIDTVRHPHMMLT